MDKKDPLEVKAMVMHFMDGESYTIQMENLSFKFDAAGLFIYEPVKPTGMIVTPNTPQRIKEFMILSNVKRIELKYYED